MAPRLRLRWCQETDSFWEVKGFVSFSQRGQSSASWSLVRNWRKKEETAALFLFYQKCIQHRNFCNLEHFLKCLSVHEYLKKITGEWKTSPMYSPHHFPHLKGEFFQSFPPKRPEKIAGIRKLEEWDRDCQILQRISKLPIWGGLEFVGNGAKRDSWPFLLMSNPSFESPDWIWKGWGWFLDVLSTKRVREFNCLWGTNLTFCGSYYDEESLIYNFYNYNNCVWINYQWIIINGFL